MKKKLTEIELAEKVIKWLECQHWDVYQEVQPSGEGPVADLVAIQNNYIWIIEVKQSLSLALLEQASHWLGYAHFVSVAHEKRRKWSKGQNVAAAFMRWKGIGELSIGHRNINMVDELIDAKLHRKVLAYYIRNRLVEEQKTFAKAGNPNGMRWTPYQQTCRNILTLVDEQPGIYLKELIDNLQHHYASNQCARSSLSHWARAGKIKGIRTETDGRYLRFYPSTK